MLALTLTLAVLGGPAAPPIPDLHLVPPLALEESPPVAPADAPDLSSPEPSPSRGVDRGRVVSASAGMLLGDAIGGGLLTLGVVMVVAEVFGGESTGGAGVGLLLAGTGAVLFLPPSLAVSFAARPETPPVLRRHAYWRAFAARLAAMFVASAIGRSEGARPLGTAVFLASELVVVPWLVVSSLGDRA